MDTFLKKMLLDTTLFEVHFTMINAPNGVKFFVFTCDQRGNTYSFNMERAGSDWRIVNAPSVTELILKNEKGLSEAINQELENSK
jgi:hypothetical protein